jgi:hypothetical protein
MMEIPRIQTWRGFIYREKHRVTIQFYIQNLFIAEHGSSSMKHIEL